MIRGGFVCVHAGVYVVTEEGGKQKKRVKRGRKKARDK